jgi:hypothetical protein
VKVGYHHTSHVAEYPVRGRVRLNPFEKIRDSFVSDMTNRMLGLDPILVVDVVIIVFGEHIDPTA